jgi:hypothetical protein
LTDISIVFDVGTEGEIDGILDTSLLLL